MRILLESLPKFVEKNLDDSLLKRRCEIRFVLFEKIGIFLKSVAKGVEERCLESREGIVQLRNTGLCKLEGIGITLGRETVNMRTAGIGESHNLGALVECLARRVVDRFADDLHVERTAYDHEL